MTAPEANGHDPAAKDALTLAGADIAAMRAAVVDAGAGLADVQESLVKVAAVQARLQREARRRLGDLCGVINRVASLRNNGYPAADLGVLETEIMDALAGSVPRRPRPNGGEASA